MIARSWSGSVRTADADEYAAYIRETGFAEYGQTAGNRGAWLLRRDENGITEFITLSLWDGIDAIRAFAGDDIDPVPRGRALLDRRRVAHRALRRRAPDPRPGSLSTRRPLPPTRRGPGVPGMRSPAASVSLGRACGITRGSNDRRPLYRWHRKRARASKAAATY